MKRPGALIFAAVLLARPVAGQKPPDFYAAIAKLPWNAAKQGPLVAVCPLIFAESSTLDGLRRKPVVLGGLTAIVPKEMTTLDSKIKAAPNLYDGLPQEDKVLYLLRTLTPAQWKQAGGDGLTIADCRGEQVAVFESILPNPLRYTMATVSQNKVVVYGERPEDQKTVGDGDRSKVRLRVVRELKLQLLLKNGEGTTATSLGEALSSPVPVILKESEEAFGQKFLTTSPNIPRKSHLDLQNSRLSAVLPLKPGETVQALLARIGAATGLNLVSDPHYAKLPIFEAGQKATARDLLAAVTLGVAGTFRRLGDTYILTSDLEGIGAHQARIAVWQDATQQMVDEQELQWRKEILQTGGLRGLSFNSAAFGNLTPEESSNMEANDRPNGALAYLPVNKGSGAVQNAVKSYRGGVDIDRDRVGIASAVRYEIILPDRQKAWGSNWLGNRDEFTDTPEFRTPPDPGAVKFPLPKPAGLVLHADTPDEAKSLIARVAAIGVSQLWLETLDAATLSAAIEAGTAANVKVSLAIRPWSILATESSANANRNVAGEHGAGLAAQKAGLASWRHFWEDNSAFAPTTRETIGMLDPSIADRSSRASLLAKTKGLAGVVALDLYPAGYGKLRNRASGSYFYSRPLDAYLALGYTEAERSAFLRIGGVDPVDIDNDETRSRIRYERIWGETVVPPGDMDRWQTAKGRWAYEAALWFANAVAGSRPDLSLLLPGQAPKTQLPPYGATYLFSWKRETELPVMNEEYGGRDIVQVADLQVVEIQDDRDPLQRNRVAALLRADLSKAEKPIFLDFTSVSAGRLDALLVRWLGTGL